MRTPTTTSCSGVWAVSSTRIVDRLERGQHATAASPSPSSSSTCTIWPSPVPQRLPCSPSTRLASWLSPWYDGDDVGRRPDLAQLALVDPRRVLAQLVDLAEAVADEHDRAPVAAELVDLLGAPALEALVADREHLVDQQHLGLDVGGDGEAEPHEHARRVVLDRRVDELLEPGELDDVVEAGR